MRVTHIAVGGEKIAARTAGWTSGGLRLLADQQRGQVDRRDFHITHDHARDHNGAVQDHHFGAIGQGDDQVAAIDLYMIYVGARRQDNDAIVDRNRPHRAGMMMMAMMVRRGLRRSRMCGDIRTVRLLVISGGIDICIAIEIHRSIPPVAMERAGRSARKIGFRMTIHSEIRSFRTAGISGSAIAPCLQSPAGGTFPQVQNRPGLTLCLYHLTRRPILWGRTQ